MYYDIWQMTDIWYDMIYSCAHRGQAKYIKYYALCQCCDDPLIVNLRYLCHFNNYCLATSDMINYTIYYSVPDVLKTRYGIYMKFNFCWLVTPAISCCSGALTIMERSGKWGNPISTHHCHKWCHCDGEEAENSRVTLRLWLTINGSSRHRCKA